MVTDYLFVGLALAVSGGMFYASVKSLIRARLIEDVPTSTIRAAAQGYVELYGTAHADDQAPLFSKLTNTQCVWHSWKVEEYQQSGKNSRWKLVGHGSSDHGILLRDNTGTCFVHPDNAEVTTERTRVWRGDTRLPIGGHQMTVFSGRYRYTEQLLLDQDWLYVLGHFETLGAPDPHAVAKEIKRDIIREWKSDQTSLKKRFDTDSDGHIDMQEWEAAQDLAQQEAEREAFTLSAEPAVSIIRARNVRNQPLIISDHDPKKLSRKYRWKAIGLLLGALIGCGFMWFLFQ